MAKISREDLRQIEREFGKNGGSGHRPTTTRVNPNLAAAATNKPLALVLTLGAPVSVHRAMASFSNDDEADSFRVNGTVVYPNVMVSMPQAVAEKIKHSNRGRKVRVTATISSISLFQDSTLSINSNQVTQIRAYLSLGLAATECWPK